MDISDEVKAKGQGTRIWSGVAIRGQQQVAREAGSDLEGLVGLLEDGFTAYPLARPSSCTGGSGLRCFVLGYSAINWA